MQHLAIIDVAQGRSPAELGPLREAEDDAVRALVANGLIEQPFLRSDIPGAIFLMNGEADALRDAIAALPAVKAGIITLTQLIPLNRHAAHPDA
jgi:hypothetical protein